MHFTTLHYSMIFNCLGRCLLSVHFPDAVNNRFESMLIIDIWEFSSNSNMHGTTGVSGNGGQWVDKF